MGAVEAAHMCADRERVDGEQWCEDGCQLSRPSALVVSTPSLGYP
jgi:hypothetical protein